jgi:hypothetical protein
MKQDNPKSDPWHDALERGYERDVVRLRWLAIATAALIVLAITIHIVLWYYLKMLDNHPRMADLPRSVVAPHQQAPSNAPPLQPTQTHDRTPPQDLAVMLQNEEAVFEHLGWKVDPVNHRVTPPEQLAQIVSQRQKSRQASTQPGGAP